MLSFLNLECPSCGAEYTLSTEELNVIVLFRCFDCEQHNIYIAGKMLELDRSVMQEGAEEDKRRHILETIQAFAREFAGNVIGSVARVINVNIEIELPETRRHKRLWRRAKKEVAGETTCSPLSPSIKLVDAPKISSQEVRDFKRIDLELIDKKVFFDRFFGQDN